MTCRPIRQVLIMADGRSERSKTMRRGLRYFTLSVSVIGLFLVLSGGGPEAAIFTQCPCYLPDAEGHPDPTQLDLTKGAVYNVATGNVECSYVDASLATHEVVCKSLAAGDGHVYMADRDRTGADPDKGDTYVFGFSDVTGVANDEVMTAGMLAANISAPTIDLREGQELYLSLTNVGMIQRPDLFDGHTVHYHGFQNAASVFDGEPMASLAVNMGSTFTYYYNNVEPGTYMWHCHFEASEHMQMGMLGNLFVRPAQDEETTLKNLGIRAPLNQAYQGFAYNDGDGSTGYHVAYPIQVTGFDPNFHHQDNSYNPLNFAGMNDTYTLFNGRGYPDTVLTSPIANINGNNSQKTNALITATRGQKILLRISSLSTVDFYTVTLWGMQMQVVGQGARLLRGPDGKNLYFTTNSITLGGGEAMDVIIDTIGVNPGTYFLYTANLNHLSNDAEDFGGMMTEIVIN
jgi:FtsP/CotA-like multicopper oxidase with cupredoxin domain